ncbi:MAG TPA: hypothetical protein VEK08_11330 [Planctomycetota bacterium]|nr:hypothetical protein [Planctomycetota bacterium]
MITSRAGEGGGLPKGLSLFRFILFSSLMLGGVYGGACIYFDPVPRAGDVPPRGIPAAQWQPSPLFLPSYMAISLRLGIEPSPKGYVFTGRMGPALYATASVFFGMLLGAAIGWVGGEAIRKWAVRKRYE